jgi:hypothetical protein
MAKARLANRLTGGARPAVPKNRRGEFVSVVDHLDSRAMPITLLALVLT